MDNLFLLLSFLSFIALIVGLIKPQLVVRWVADEKRTRGRVLLTYGVAIIAFFILFGITAKPVEPTSASKPTATNSNKSSVFSESDKKLLKKKYSDFNTQQRTQFAEIEEKYNKMTGAEKKPFKADFERLSKERDEQVAKWAEEEKAAKEAKAAEKAKAIADLKAQAQIIPYKDLARNPEKYKSAKVKYTGEVIQVQEDGNDVLLRVNVTKDEYGLYDDTVAVLYDKNIVKSRVLEKDIITFYGTSEGLLTYETVMGAELSIPQVNAQIVEIN